jgi:hypothetical protein
MSVPIVTPSNECLYEEVSIQMNTMFHNKNQTQVVWFICHPSISQVHEFWIDVDYEAVTFHPAYIVLQRPQDAVTCS